MTRSKRSRASTHIYAITSSSSKPNSKVLALISNRQGENQRTFLAAGEDSPDLLATVSATLQKAERRARDAADALAITVEQRKAVERKLAEAKDRASRGHSLQS